MVEFKDPINGVVIYADEKSAERLKKLGYKRVGKSKGAKGKPDKPEQVEEPTE